MTKGVFDEKDKKKVFVVLFVLLLCLALFIIKDFLNALIVGALIAYFIFPLYTRLVKKVKSEKIAAGILSAISIAILIIILIILVLPIISQTQILYKNSGKYIAEGINLIEKCDIEDSALCAGLNLISSATNNKNFKEEIDQIMKKTSLFFTESISSLVGSIISFILFIVVVLFSIFYLLDHGEKIKDTIISLVPLTTNHKKEIMKRLRETIHAVILGNISTALLQGILGAFIFWILGIPSPLFWGLIMAILAFIPAVGPAVIWIPTTIILIIQDDILKAIVLVIGGTLMLIIDSFVKPKLIGDRMKMSSFMIFLGVLGGLKVFGILGLFFGPIILAVLATVIKIYQEEMV